jgi:hypothetical protein
VSGLPFEVEVMVLLLFDMYPVAADRREFITVLARESPCALAVK